MDSKNNRKEFEMIIEYIHDFKNDNFPKKSIIIATQTQKRFTFQTVTIS